jgi:hypothetical protein
MSGGDEVGRGHPAKRGRRKERRATTTAEIIDKLFLAPIEITENGGTRRVTTLEAILLQLWRKELDGNRRALAARLKYEELDQRNTETRTEITFADSPYTEACGTPRSETDDDDKV